MLIVTTRYSLGLATLDSSRCGSVNATALTGTPKTCNARFWEPLRHAPGMSFTTVAPLRYPDCPHRSYSTCHPEPPCGVKDDSKWRSALLRTPRKRQPQKERKKRTAPWKGSYHKAGFELPNKEKGVRTILFVLLFTRLACKV